MPYWGILHPARPRADYKTIVRVSDGNIHTTYQAHKIPKGWRDNPKDYFLEPKHRTPWFIKEELDCKIAHRELLAQELFRLLAVGQPKTRIAKETFLDRANRVIEKNWVVSKGVNGFMSFWKYYTTHQNSYKKLIDRLLSGAVSGLGQSLVTALWVNEVDGHEGNYGVDEKGKVIKIDGDECFARLDPALAHFTGNGLITTRDLKTLPFIQDYGTCNWLDLIAGHQYRKNGALGCVALQNSPKIRQEVLEGILNIISMPDSFLDHFTHSYIQDLNEVVILSQELKDRKKMLTQAAFGMPEFRAYLHTPAAQQCAKQQLENIQNFKIRSKYKIWDPSFQAAFEATFLELRQQPLGPGVARLMNRPQPILQAPPPVQYFGACPKPQTLRPPVSRPLAQQQAAFPVRP